MSENINGRWFITLYFICHAPALRCWLFYIRTISSVWGHFGCFTRSAFRRTSSHRRKLFLNFELLIMFI